MADKITPDMEGTLRVITNHVPREIIDGALLTESERKDFDYLDWQAIDDGRDSASFVRYKGELIDVGTFERSDSGIPWHGYRSNSFFSAVAIRLCDDGESAVLGTVLS